MKKIALVFLGDFFYDARCVNMALSLKKNYVVFVFSDYKKIHLHKSFDKINFIKIQLTKSGILRYWEHYNKTLRALNQHSFDSICILWQAPSMQNKNEKLSLIVEKFILL